MVTESIAPTARLVRYEPLRPYFLADPYPLYSRLRNDRPVYWDRRFGWIVSRYNDVASALIDPRLSVQRPLPDDPIPIHLQPIADKVRAVRAMQSRWILFSDAPQHTRLRELVEPAFTRPRIAALRVRVQQLVDELLDAVDPESGMDVVDDLAFPLPSTIIAELLGVPVADRQLLREWSHDIVGASILSVTKIERAYASQEALVAYLRDLIVERRDKPADDLLGVLLQGERAGALSEEEVIGTCVMFLFVGHETTTNLIGNGTLALLRDPAAQQLVRDEPDLIDSAVEELARYDSPVQVAYRSANEDIELGGAQIANGEHMLLLIGSANRDAERFSDPERLNLTRQPNRHLSYSAGAHYCLGAWLARLECQIALRSLFTRFPNMRLGSGPIQFRPDILLRGLENLPVVFG